MSDVAICYDNSRMESWFATLNPEGPKKEKLYKINTAEMTVEEAKQIVWRYTFVYYKRQWVTTVNPGGWPPSIYRERTTAK